MPESYCFVCLKKRDGIGIKRDYVLDSLRWAKKKLGRESSGNRIVVCKECYPQYTKLRKKYVSRQYTYIGLGTVFIILGLLIHPSIGAFLVGLGLLVFLFLLSLLSYMPELDLPSKQEKRTNK